MAVEARPEAQKLIDLFLDTISARLSAMDMIEPKTLLVHPSIGQRNPLDDPGGAFDLAWRMLGMALVALIDGRPENEPLGITAPDSVTIKSVREMLEKMRAQALKVVEQMRSALRVPSA